MRTDRGPESLRLSGAPFVPLSDFRSLLTLSGWMEILLADPMNGERPPTVADRVAGFGLRCKTWTQTHRLDESNRTFFRTSEWV